MNRNQTIKLSVPVDKDYLPFLLSHINTAATFFGVKQKSVGEIELACEEALVNIIEHGEHFDEKDSLEIECMPSEKGMEIIIHERGIPFNPQNASKYTLPKALEEMMTQGLGLFLMQQFMDSVVYNNLGPEGLEIRLIKNWESDEQKSRHAVAMIDDNELSVPAQDIDNIKARIAVPGDAIEIVRCAYRLHGYTFWDSMIYDYQKLAKDISERTIISVVAVLPGGRVVGHAAWLYHRPEDTIVEATYGFVDPAYLNQGVLKKIAIEQWNYLETSNTIKGSYSLAVTNHVYSQKILHQYGFKDCGIRLASTIESWKSKGVTNDFNNERISDIVSYISLRKQSQALFLPVRHADMITRLYSYLGLDREFLEAEPCRSSFSHQSDLTLDKIDHDKDAEIFVASYGDDVVTEIRKILRGLCVDGYVSILLFLSLENPATPGLVPAFEEMGFFFSGILPMTLIGDALMLQYLNNSRVDYSKIQIYSETGKRLLKYIQSCDPWAEVDGEQTIFESCSASGGEPR